MADKLRRISMNKNIKVMGSVILSAVLAQSMLPLHIYAIRG